MKVGRQRRTSGCVHCRVVCGYRSWVMKPYSHRTTNRDTTGGNRGRAVTETVVCESAQRLEEGQLLARRPSEVAVSRPDPYRCLIGVVLRELREAGPGGEPYPLLAQPVRDVRGRAAEHEVGRSHAP